MNRALAGSAKPNALFRHFDTQEDDYCDVLTFRHFDILTVTTKTLNFCQNINTSTTTSYQKKTYR